MGVSVGLLVKGAIRGNDGNVIEVEDDTSRVYAANGELLRTVTGEPVE